MNILAVDDEYYALELMKGVLAEVAPGARVYPCSDVSSAIKTATENNATTTYQCVRVSVVSGRLLFSSPFGRYNNLSHVI